MILTVMLPLSCLTWLLVGAVDVVVVSWQHHRRAPLLAATAQPLPPPIHTHLPKTPRTHTTTQPGQQQPCLTTTTTSPPSYKCCRPPFSFSSSSSSSSLDPSPSSPQRSPAPPPPPPPSPTPACTPASPGALTRSTTPNQTSPSSSSPRATKPMPVISNGILGGKATLSVPVGPLRGWPRW